MILDELAKMSDRWSRDSQPKMEEANVAALGASDVLYTVVLKNGARISGVSGPSGLSVGNAVALMTYPGKARHPVIVQRTAEGREQSPTVVGV